MATLTILGSGEAFDPQVPNSSLLYQGAQTVLVDCGFAAVQALWRRSRDPEFLDAVLLTHHHADHTFGLPALLMWLRNDRRRKLTVIGPPDTKQYLTALFDLAYAPGMDWLKFPLDVIECVPGDAVAFGALNIKTALPNHGISVLSTRWEAGGVSHFAYSADGKVTPQTRRLFKNSNVLVHECYGMPGREGPVHAHIETVLEVAAESGVSTLVIVHQQYEQRQLIADFMRAQKIFSGQVLMPEGVMAVTVG